MGSGSALDLLHSCGVVSLKGYNEVPKVPSYPSVLTFLWLALGGYQFGPPAYL